MHIFRGGENRNQNIHVLYLSHHLTQISLDTQLYILTGNPPPTPPPHSPKMTSTQATHNIHKNTARRIVPRPDGPATVLAIGTAVPPNVFLQKDYPDFYFGITDSNHKSELKHKFKRICK